MKISSRECIIVDGFHYYNFDVITSPKRCQDIAKQCQERTLLALIQTVVCATLAAFTLALPYFTVKNILHFCAMNNLALAGLVVSCPAAGLSGLPFLMLCIATARYWSYYQNLEKQINKANLKETLINCFASDSRQKCREI